MGQLSARSLSARRRRPLPCWRSRSRSGGGRGARSRRIRTPANARGGRSHVRGPSGRFKTAAPPQGFLDRLVWRRQRRVARRGGGPAAGDCEKPLATTSAPTPFGRWFFRKSRRLCLLVANAHDGSFRLVERRRRAILVATRSHATVSVPRCRCAVASTWSHCIEQAHGPLAGPEARNGVTTLLDLDAMPSPWRSGRRGPCAHAHGDSALDAPPGESRSVPASVILSRRDRQIVRPSPATVGVSCQDRVLASARKRKAQESPKTSPFAEVAVDARKSHRD